MPNTQTYDSFKTHLTDMLKEYGDQVANNLIDEGKILLEKNIRMKVAQMAVSLAKEATIERNAQEIIIRVKFDGGQAFLEDKSKEED